jgi:hypothetical protein
MTIRTLARRVLSKMLTREDLTILRLTKGLSYVSTQKSGQVSMDTEMIYKKCVVTLPTHQAIGPASSVQASVRSQLAILMAGIREPHCQVCGDTEAQSTILKIPTQASDVHLWSFVDTHRCDESQTMPRSPNLRLGSIKV